MSKPSPFPHGYGFPRRLRDKSSAAKSFIVKPRGGSGTVERKAAKKGCVDIAILGAPGLVFLCKYRKIMQMCVPELLSEGGGNWGVHIPPLLRHCVEPPLRSTSPSVFLSSIWAGWTSSGTRQKHGCRNTRHVCHSDKSVGMQGRLWWYLLCFVSCVT